MRATWHIVVLSFLLLAFSSIGYASAGTACPSSTSNTIQMPQNFVGIALLALTISIDVVAFGYVLARLVPGTGIRGWLDNEYWEIAKSAMLIAGIYAILMFVSSISLILAGCPPPAGGNVASNINTLISIDSASYFQPAANEINTKTSELYSVSFWLGFFRNVQLTITVPIPLLPGVTLLSGFRTNIYSNPLLEQGPTTGTYESILNDAFTMLIFPITMLFVAQEIGLTYIVAIGLGILIPLGIVFRAFPFIRGVGGTLVGIGFALAVIYPAAIALINIPVNNALALQTAATGSGCTLSGLFGSFICSLTAYVSVLTGGISTAAEGIGTIYPVLNELDITMLYFILQLMLFIIDLVVAYVLGDNIARKLGGTLRLSLGGKLKLV